MIDKERILKDLQRIETTSSIRWMYPPEGVLRVRIIPRPEDPATFHLLVYNHKVTLPDGERSVLCANKTYGERCPICDIRSILLQSEGAVEKSLADALRPYARMYTNALIIGWRRTLKDQSYSLPPNSPITEEDKMRNPVLLVLPLTVARYLLTLVLQNDFTDLKNGFDIEIVRTSSGKQVNYVVQPIFQPYPVPNPDEVMSNAYNLDKVARDRLIDYENLMADSLEGMVRSGLALPAAVEQLASKYLSVQQAPPISPSPTPQIPSSPPTPPQQPTPVVVPDEISPPPSENAQPTPPPPPPQPTTIPQPPAEEPATPTSQPSTPTPEPTPIQKPVIDEDLEKKLEELRRKMSGGG